MSRNILIAPSLLAADFSKLGDEIRRVDQAGCDLIHVDVMDGHFVPNISVGPVVIRAMRRETRLPLDVHLMIESPWDHLKPFADAGADHLIVHQEACGDRLKETLSQIKSLGKKCGVSLKPDTPIQSIESVLDQVDLVLIMTVEPGFGGQTFMPRVIPKIAELRSKFDGPLAVDGGINLDTCTEVVRAGADVLVAGTAIFSISNPKNVMRQMKNCIRESRLNG